MTSTTVSRSGRGSPATGPRAFEEIHLSTLRLDSELPFCLFTKIEGEYIVYRRADQPFTYTQRRALIENRIETLYIDSEQVDLYWRYLKESLHDLIGERELPIEERASVIYRSSRELTRQVLGIPFPPDSLNTARSIVHDSMRFLSEGKVSLHAMMAQMGESPMLFSHALNVTHYGLALAREIGIRDDQELEPLGIGLICQDLGMLKISEDLVFKAGPLSFEEWSLVKRHPSLGLEALEKVPDFPAISRLIVFGHHERLDGSGYPRGLAGDELSVHLRITGIADVFASLTCARPHRDPASSFEALRIMKTEMSGCFDPKILDVFVRLLGN